MTVKNSAGWPMKSPLAVSALRAPIAAPSVWVGRMIEQTGNLRSRKMVGSGMIRLVWRSLEFPRFGGHLLTEFARSGRMSADAKDPAVLVGVPLGGREVAPQQWSFGPAARSRARRLTAVVA